MQMEQALDAIVDRSVVLDDPVEVFGIGGAAKWLPRWPEGRAGQSADVIGDAPCGPTDHPEVFDVAVFDQVPVFLAVVLQNGGIDVGGALRSRPISLSWWGAVKVG